MQAGNNLRFGVKIGLGEVEIRNKIVKTPTSTPRKKLNEILLKQI